jgi:hypothetical protein
MKTWIFIALATVVVAGGAYWWMQQPNNNPSASIDQNSLYSSQKASFSIAGSASGVTKLHIRIVPDIPGLYPENSDLQYLLDQVYGGATAFVSSDTAVVANGRWATTPNKGPMYENGKYRVFVFDLSNTAILDSGRDTEPTCAPIACKDVQLLATGTLKIIHTVATNTCMLTVDKVDYPIAPCDKEGYGEREGIDFGMHGSVYFIYGVNTTDEVGGWWNGPAASSHAHEPLPGGQLTKVDNCYQNSRVKLCEAQQ